MPLTPATLRPLVDTYLTLHPKDRPALTGLLALLSDDSGERFPAARATLPGHVTCGAVVIDRARRVLHIGHRSSGLTLTPGGHAEEADASLLAVAVREVGEETGLPASRLCLTPYALDAPFDIDVHAIDARQEKGEPAHEHYDFRFLFYLTDDAPPVLALQEEEVTGATWLPFPEIRSTTLRAKLLAAEREWTAPRSRSTPPSSCTTGTGATSSISGTCAKASGCRARSRSWAAAGSPATTAPRPRCGASWARRFPGSCRPGCPRTRTSTRRARTA